MKFAKRVDAECSYHTHTQKLLCEVMDILINLFVVIISGFPGGPADKEFACNVGDLGSIPGLGRSPGEGSEVATHSSILAWRIPWMEEPGRLQSTGSQRVRHD